MSTCEHCGNESPVTAVLNHVSFDTSPVSKLVSSYRVCLSCRNELKDNPKIEW